MVKGTTENSSFNTDSFLSLGNGCLRHMIGDKSKFVKFKERESGFVTYGDNNKGNILGIGKICVIEFTIIKDVL